MGKRDKWMSHKCNIVIKIVSHYILMLNIIMDDRRKSKTIENCAVSLIA